MTIDNLWRSMTTLGAIVVLGLASLAGFLATPLHAQTAADARAIAIVRNADLAFAHEGRIPSRETFERALTAAIAQGDRSTEAIARRGIGVLLRKQARYAEARIELLSALQIHEALGDRGGAGWTRHHLGWVAYEYETRAAADEQWTRGLADMQAAGDRRGEAQMLLNRTSVAQPGPEKAALLQHVREFARAIGDVRTEAGALYNIGTEQLLEGNCAAALPTFQQALAGFERVGSEHSTARVLLRLGWLHLGHGDPGRAGAFYMRAIDLLRRVGDKLLIAEAMGAMVNVHDASGRLRQAVVAARRALALRIEIGGTRNINLMRVRLARLYLDLGDARRAKVLLDDVVRGPDALARDLAYDPLAEAHLALGQYEQARDAADLAARTAREPVARPFMLANRARAEEKLRQSSRALESIDEALRIVEQVRGRLVPTDSMKQGYAERVQGLFALAIGLLHKAGRDREALEVSERARARAFRDLLATRADGDRRGLGTSSVANARPNPALESSASAPPLSAEQLGEVARRLDSTIVSYWVGPESTVIWVVARDGTVRATAVAVPLKRLAALVRRAAGDLRSPRSRGEEATRDVMLTRRGDALVMLDQGPPDVWRQLYDLLIRPVRSLLPSARGSLLTIVPHGPLFTLSFAALLDERRRYLLEDYRLHYAPAGGVLRQRSREQTTPDRLAAMKYVLVANPTTSGAVAGEPLPPLPGTVREVDAIAAVLPRGAATMLTGRAAREDVVRRAFAGRAVIHLATHGVLRDDRVLDSFLALHPGAGADDDGRLTTAEIYGLELDAEVVVLSACRSGRGPVTGDGVIGMTRAFFYAGASSIVATLWDVADESAAQIMPAFYRSWRRALDKTTALRVAQLDLLERLRAGRVVVPTPAGPRPLPAHPFFWAGFVLIGEP